ncbi:MAG TPA: hypothetical protein VMD56_07470 [Steroidobacteraceae bacterium]|nr:hypothetical protein [Steroidobacteraceae bacterium]
MAAKPASGRPRRLAARDLSRLRRMLMKGGARDGVADRSVDLPTRRAAERDEERIQAWIKQDWPRVKKTLRT